jgi:hypothetical protein
MDFIPSSMGQKWFLVCNVHIVYGYLKSEKLSRLFPETSSKLYVHEFGFWYRATSLIVGITGGLKASQWNSEGRG